MQEAFPTLAGFLHLRTNFVFGWIYLASAITLAAERDFHIRRYGNDFLSASVFCHASPVIYLIRIRFSRDKGLWPVLRRCLDPNALLEMRSIRPLPSWRSRRSIVASFQWASGVFDGPHGQD